MFDIPQVQQALQLVAPDEMLTNDAKPVHRPGPGQLLCRVEAVGLCFSDLKLLKQFASHGRKGEVVSGVDKSVLDALPSYVPGEKPAVPGHEAVVTVVARGEGVAGYEVGGKYLVQADYRWVRTASTNGAFGYNFEGGLQEYVLLDTRVFTSPDGESTLLTVPGGLSNSSIALVEPWACVEDAYRSSERKTVLAGGCLLAVADGELSADVLCSLLDRSGRPARIVMLAPGRLPEVGQPVERLQSPAELPADAFDDIIYFGSDPDIAEKLFPALASGGLINIVLGGGSFGREVTVPIGRVHYGGIRITGTAGDDPAAGLESIPPTGEVRSGERIEVIGAGGPMGVMHVIRNVSLDIPGLSLYACDVDDGRLEALSRLARPMAEMNRVAYKPCNTVREKPEGSFTYIALMVPSPALVAAAIAQVGDRAVINIFAGIPASEQAVLDLDLYIRRRAYFIGTSGSTIDDMKSVLAKVTSGRLSTDVSVAAVADLASAAQGIRAVESRSIAGKIIVYPACRGLGLVELKDMPEKLPEIARLLDNGVWNKRAEDALLEMFGRGPL